ncbi:hypothetical protein [Lacipirellula sp.]|uniref:hypothetical protein n=1 Tax=Lacipirellula sp. TaxID=2691419 RepID=UPI003D148E24
MSKPDPAIQERIQKVLGTAKRHPGGLHENAQAVQEAIALKDSVADKGEIVKQIAIYAGDPDGEEMQPLIGLMLLHLLDLPPKVVIQRLAPHLDSPNPKLRSFVRDWFQGHDNVGRPDPLRPVNYEDYLEYLRSNSFPPGPFIKYVYERSPGRALILFHRSTRRADAIAALEKVAENVEANRKEAGLAAPRVKPMRPDEFLLAEHVVEDAIWAKQNKFHERFENTLPEAKEYLAKLSKHNQWWVRLYSAEIMRQHPELQIEEAIIDLQADENELVRDAALGVRIPLSP